MNWITRNNRGEHVTEHDWPEHDYSITVAVHYLDMNGEKQVWRSSGNLRRSGAMQDYLKRYMPGFTPLYSELT